MNTTPAQKQPITILLAEDNPADVELTRCALDEAKINHVLQVVEDGEEALLYLSKQGKYKDAEKPDIILLDLNLPRMSGKEVLRDIKNNKSLENVPVVIVSSSQAKIDIRDSYRLEADYYITKPLDSDKIRNVLGLDTQTGWFLP